MYLHTYRKELKYRGLQWRIVPVTPEVEGSSPFRTAERKFTCNQRLTFRVAGEFFVYPPQNLPESLVQNGTFGRIMVQKCAICVQ